MREGDIIVFLVCDCLGPAEMRALNICDLMLCWKNGHMVTAVTVTAIQTLQNRGCVYKYIYLTVVLMPCTSDGEALYDSKECLL